MLQRTAILFDLDGTLLDSARTICDSVSAALGTLGVRVDPSEVAPHLGAPLEELYTLFVGDGPRAHLERFVDAYIAFHDAHPEQASPAFPGVEETLAALKEAGTRPLAVATTKPTHRARMGLEATGLAHFFDHIQGTDPGMAPKPAPDVILRACAAIGHEPARVVMVGDTHRDIDAARAAGALSALVVYGAGDPEKARALGADVVVSSLTELLALLDPA